MITIITGVPGMGKTSLVVSMMMRELEKGERPFFVMGIPDLALDHSPVPPIVEWTEKRPDPNDPSVELDYFTFPPNSIIIIDEAQRVYRPRASTSKVPPHVAAHETHRHTGVDFWLMTQKPMLIDAHIRELCGRHIHIRNTFTGRKLFEWPEFTDVKTKGNYADAAVRRFKPPKQSFNNYKSAELHTKQPYRLHYVWLFLPVALGFTLYQGYGVYSNYKRHTDRTAETTVQDETSKLDVKQSLNLIGSDQAPDLQHAVDTRPAPPIKIEHPYMQYKFIIMATITSPTRKVTYYRLSNGDGQDIDLTDKDLSDLGYVIKQPNDCSAFLFFNGASITAACNRHDAAPLRGGVTDTGNVLPM
ncbi:zonular occludens toxin domain-containing protein [Methylobacillus sp.]|uniref:zonular occludens toxin domain-containing protein n=1 Tax=Methylobacillus sp. TaxID=56818 RepID=UPI002FE20F8F